MVATTTSLLSAGTERMLVQFGRAGLINKARQQPEKVRQVLDKARTDGVAATVRAVRSKLDQPMPMGYCNAGAVIGVGAGVTGFQTGDRVASNGPHAEIVSVPVNLCARIPEAVSDEAAAFTVLGAIALQGIRLVQPTLGETVVVTGLGLIGLLTVQLLRAQGCRVLGIDFDSERLKLAARFGAEVVNADRGEDPVARAHAYSRGRGVDAVIVTASTKSSDPIHQAATMCRQRGRIVLVGVTGLELSRADFYEKELSFQVSCSYGPGRYDREYEAKGHDYPVGFVRWTEQRNFEAFLDMLADGRIDVAPLVTHRYPIERAAEAYDLIVGESSGALGVILDYPVRNEPPAAALRTVQTATVIAAPASGATLGIIGAGSYADQVLVPALRSAGARLKTIVSAAGVSGVHLARRNAIETSSTDPTTVIDDPEIDAVVIATRHDSHARYVCEALAAGKQVFVEKPLALTAPEIDLIEAAWIARANGLERRPPLLMVGFNRRFAPQVLTMKRLLDGAGLPKSFVVTVNAGAIPHDHWIQDPAIGGGRIIGEACHFIDLLRFLVGHPISGYTVSALATGGRAMDDVVTMTLRFADGSLGTVHYFATGHRAHPKERIEAFCAGRVLVLDNFRRLSGHGWPGFRGQRLWRQDKGNAACAAAFVAALRRGGAAPIAFDEILEVTRVTLAIAEQARRGGT